jgi:protocatechuate 3,4-dioxygenase beta subunit
MVLQRKVSRREVLGLMAAAGAAAIVGCGDDDGDSTRPTATEPSATQPPSSTSAATATRAPELSCVVSPEMTEGPYFVDEMLNRSDIREDPSDGSVVEGTPLFLTLAIYQVTGEACTPLSGALVDIWHCDAAGRYSDVAQNGTAGQKFLRGYQLTNENGAVSFTSVYPGWYTGRAVHIHMKVRTDPGSEQGFEFTSQLFFDDVLTEQVYAQAPYSKRGAPDTLNENDSIYQGGGSQMLLALSPQSDGYAGSMNIGVQMS